MVVSKESNKSLRIGYMIPSSILFKRLQSILSEGVKENKIERFDGNFKIAVLGRPQVGKSSIINSISGIYQNLSIPNSVNTISDRNGNIYYELPGLEILQGNNTIAEAILNVDLMIYVTNSAISKIEEKFLKNISLKKKRFSSNCLCK